MNECVSGISGKVPEDTVPENLLSMSVYEERSLGSILEREIIKFKHLVVCLG